MSIINELGYLQNALNAMMESYKKDSKLLREALEEEGINYEEKIKKGEQLAKQLRREYAIDKAKEKRIQINKIISDFNTFINKTVSKEEILDHFKSLFHETTDYSEPAVQTFFHKLKQVDIEDMRDLIHDAELINLISNILNQKDN